MIDHFYSNPNLLQHWRHGPLVSQLDQFADLLIQQGFSRNVGRSKLRVVAQLSQWLGRKRILLSQLDGQKVSAFQAARRKHCQPDTGEGGHADFAAATFTPSGPCPCRRQSPRRGPH